MSDILPVGAIFRIKSGHNQMIEDTWYSAGDKFAVKGYIEKADAYSLVEEPDEVYVLTKHIDFETVAYPYPSKEELGRKFDSGKPRWSLIPWVALKEIVDVLTYGSLKYEDNNWQYVEPKRYKDAALRHFTSWLSGERYDPETGKSHLAHLGCSVLFLLWFELNGRLDE